MVGCGETLFAVLSPGSRLRPHCGSTNARLTAHFGVRVPPGAQIRAGAETRTWTEGDCIVFDDSFEHEVWHDGDDDRVVLICDLWHPDVHLATMIEPLLNPRQLEALQHAQAGRHLPIESRTYSSGQTVTRSA